MARWCPAFCSAGCGTGPAYRPPGIDCLVRAERQAGTGCPAALCISDSDCDDGNPFSQDACTARGCESDCLAVGP